MYTLLFGDIRQSSNIGCSWAIRGIDIVVHAAALKHVSLFEYNPTECIATNIIGAQNIIESAIINQFSKL